MRSKKEIEQEIRKIKELILDPPEIYTLGRQEIDVGELRTKLKLLRWVLA